jgi:hypothetical protein
MSRKSIAPGRQPVYRSKLFQDFVHDAYKSSEKLPSPTLCPECGAVYSAGRWQWLPGPDAAHRELCPACHRTRDRFPAGHVRLEGEFAAKHREEVLQLLHNLEKRERSEHPLQRIMDITDAPGAILVTTTDVHLAHGIGEALRHAYKGTLDSHYNREEKLLRVVWRGPGA